MLGVLLEDAAQAANPVVQVIDGDEQNVRSFSGKFYRWVRPTL